MEEFKETLQADISRLGADLTWASYILNKAKMANDPLYLEELKRNLELMLPKLDEAIKKWKPKE